MLQISGPAFHCCDGVTRRNAIQVGMLGLGGLSLPAALRARARAADSGDPRATTSVIYLELAGGPTHIETYDPKPDAPEDYRGPLGVVATREPGVYLSEMMAEQAKVFDRLAIIRSLHHDSSSHRTSSHLTQTGYYLRDRQNSENEMPCIGSITARLRGANAPGIPPLVSIPQAMRFGRAAFLGKGFNAFETGGDPNSAKFVVRNVSLVRGLSTDRLSDRRELLARFDEARRVVDTNGVADALDDFTKQAFDIVTGDRAKQAFDIEAETPQVRDRYGRNTVGQSMLLARRLVEAGVTFVTVRVGGWDDHNNLVARLKQKAPQYDRGVAALVTDLHERGLEQDVMVVALGEFGRTPRVNRNAGRDHWGALMSGMIAGGGIPHGQVIGKSNSKGEVPVESPYRPEHVLAVVYRHLGIDTQATFTDFAGRPRYVLARSETIRELA